jgi:hypothetical protein
MGRVEDEIAGFLAGKKKGAGVAPEPGTTVLKNAVDQALKR